MNLKTEVTLLEHSLGRSINQVNDMLDTMQEVQQEFLAIEGAGKLMKGQLEQSRKQAIKDKPGWTPTDLVTGLPILGQKLAHWKYGDFEKKINGLDDQLLSIADLNSKAKNLFKKATEDRKEMVAVKNAMEDIQVMAINDISLIKDEVMPMLDDLITLLDKSAKEDLGFGDIFAR